MAAPFSERMARDPVRTLSKLNRRARQDLRDCKSLLDRSRRVLGRKK